MSYRSLSAFTVRPTWPSVWGTTDAKLVIVLNRDVVSQDGIQYEGARQLGATSLRSLGFYFSSIITVTDGVGSAAAIANLPTTDTTTPAHVALYYAYIYVKGSLKATLTSRGFHLHESINGDESTFSWHQWVNAQQWRQGSTQLPMISDRVTVQSMIDAANLAAGIATTTSLGRVKVDTAPVDPANPIAVGTNSTLVALGTTDLPGRVELATSGETASGVAVQGSDARLAAATTSNRGTSTGTTNNSVHVSTDDPRMLSVEDQETFSQAVRSVSAGPIIVLESTNLLPTTFNHGARAFWGLVGAAGGLALMRNSDSSPGSARFRYSYGGTNIQLADPGTTGQALADYLPIIPIDATKAYYLGGQMGWESNSADLNFNITEISGGSLLVGATPSIVITKTPVDAATLSETVGAVNQLITAAGGAAPTWSSSAITGTLGIKLSLQRVNGAIGSIYIHSLWLVKEEQFPSNVTTVSNPGFGATHECATDGTFLYTVGHTTDRICKFNQALVRQASVTVPRYPHAILYDTVRSVLWCITYGGIGVATAGTLEKIDPATMTVTASYPLLGNRKGYGIGWDGAGTLYLGCGDSGFHGTDGILKFDIATAVNGTTTGQTVLSGDIAPNGSNSPCVVLGTSVWSNKHNAGQVMRISTVGGSTLATINAGIGYVYGMGTDGTYIYAAGSLGVVKIDPATNTVVATYKFRHGFYSTSNPKPDGLGRMWGSTQIQGSVWYVDTTHDVIVETPAYAGQHTWVQPLNDYVYGGYYVSPVLEIYTAGQLLR